MDPLHSATFKDNSRISPLFVQTAILQVALLHCLHFALSDSQRKGSHPPPREHDCMHACTCSFVHSCEQVCARVCVCVHLLLKSLTTDFGLWQTMRNESFHLKSNTRNEKTVVPAVIFSRVWQIGCLKEWAVVKVRVSVSLASFFFLFLQSGTGVEWQRQLLHEPSIFPDDSGRNVQEHSGRNLPGNLHCPWSRSTVAKALSMLPFAKHQHIFRNKCHFVRRAFKTTGLSSESLLRLLTCHH